MANSTALVTTDSSSLLPSAETWRTMVSMATALFQSGLLPDHVKTPQAAVAIVQKGVELRVPPMYALSNISVINGKPACSAELMLALIYREQGDDAVIPVESTDETCTYSYKRRSWPKYFTHTFTIDDAKRAGLIAAPRTDSKRVAPWIAYPAAMLRARCVSALARLAFPDVIAGMYTPEELGNGDDESPDFPSGPPPRTTRPDAPQTLPDAPSATTVVEEENAAASAPEPPPRASQEQYDAIIQACAELFVLTNLTFELRDDMTATEAAAELRCIEEKAANATFSPATVSVGITPEQQVKVERALVEYAKRGEHLDRPPVSFDSEQIEGWLDDRRRELTSMRKKAPRVAATVGA